MEILYAGGATPDTGSGGGSGGSSTTIKAVNKTGKAIATGDKVWLNENAQTAGTSFVVSQVPTFMSRTGNQAWANGTLYSLSSTSAKSIGSLSVSGIKMVKYAADNSVFGIGTSSLQSYRIDEGGTYTASGLPIGDDYFYSSNGLKKLNMATGEVIKSWSWSISPSDGLVKVGNYIYLLASSYKHRYYINDTTIDDYGTYTGSNFGSENIYPLGVTADNKYIVCGQGQSETFYNANYGTKLRLIEIVSETNLKMLSQSEMPTDLQPFYEDKYNYVTFNPYTGVLCVTSKGSAYLTYAIMKYENETWNKLPIDLGVTLSDNNYIQAGITVSDDLTRACIGAIGYLSKTAKVVNLETTKGYVSVPYKLYNVNSKTLTAIASSDVETDGEFTATTGTIREIGAKYGATVDNFLGDVNSNGLLEPTYGEARDITFTGVKTIQGQLFLAYKFGWCQSIGVLNFPDLENINNPESMYNFCFKSTVTEVHFPKLVGINGESSLGNAFTNCSRLTEATFPSLETVSDYGMFGCFQAAGQLSTVDFSSLTTLGSVALGNAFTNCSSLTSISFPSLQTIAKDAFGTTSSFYAFRNCNYLTEIHFRADMQATIEAMTGYAAKWGATNATIYFDL